MNTRRSVTACCPPAGDAPPAGVGCPDRVKPQRNRRAPFGVAGPTGRLDVWASASERTELLEVLQIRTGRGPCVECCRNWGGADDPAHRRGDGAVAAVHAAGPGSGLPVGARGADAAPSGTIGAFVPVPRRTRGKLAEPDRRAAQARADVATIGILQHRAARDAAAMNE